MLFDTFVGIGVVAIQVFLVIAIISLITKSKPLYFIARHSTAILRIIFFGAVLGSVIYSEYFNYPPCILCWYQRLAIFPIAIILFTGSLKHFLIRQQVLLFSILGFIVSAYHTYIDIFLPEGVTVCGADGISCTARYVYEFGYITIPVMSFTVLLSGIIITLIAKRYPQEVVAKK
jgi:disulfide bond formation protein DsbB